MNSQPPCEVLPWDCEFFGFPIARVCHDRITDALCSEIDAWCAQHDIACLYFLARIDDPQTVQLARKNGFELVDVRVTLERTISTADHIAPQPMFRRARTEDMPALEAIAGTSHHDSRFYFDSHFDRSKCDAMFVQWIRGSGRGPAAALWVEESNGSPGGYVSCQIEEATKTGRIGLLAVAEFARGRGLGNRLVRQALSWFSSNGVERASVVTQGRNIPSQRLYQRHGFLTRNVQLYYHKWYRPSANRTQ